MRALSTNITFRNPVLGDTPDRARLFCGFSLRATQNQYTDGRVREIGLWSKAWMRIPPVAAVGFWVNASLISRPLDPKK